uniref:Pentacotripeptide-repeat region of PRORP domain-containing protein n=1 Tax=Calcidiscus leptoporus TaxID=127549 RepID=A0A7S0JEN8_9EUKA
MWRAGLLDVRTACEQAMQRLEQARVPPPPVLLATLAYMHVAQGDASGLDALLRRLAAPSYPRAGGEGPYVAALRAVRRESDLGVVTGTLRAMAEAGVPPSAGTRAAICRILAQRSSWRRLAPPPLPSAPRFWKLLPLPFDEQLGHLKAYNIDANHLAAVVREGHTASVLARMSHIISLPAERRPTLIAEAISRCLSSH